MIRTENGELLCECDGCGQERAGGVADFQEFIRDMKADGWRIRKEGDGWEHYCDECVEEMQ